MNRRGFLGEHGFFSKRFMYDQALCMPFLVCYPGRFAAGTVKDDMTTNVDFAPTLLDMAGLPLPASLRGRSFMRNLRGRTPGDWPRAVYYRYWQHLLHRDVAAHYGIRTKTRKLIFSYGLPLDQTNYKPTAPEWEMFDLEKDPGEMRNVYGDLAYARDAEQLKRELLHLKQTGDGDEASPELMDARRRYWD